jgi:hypothetical protein
MMSRSGLTPIERGVLFILMAHGQPITRADLRKSYGLEVRKRHRLNLEQQGLIQVSGKGITFALSKLGWEWLARELTAPRPKGVLGLGTLYAVLGAIDRLAKRLNLPIEEALGTERTVNNGTGGEVRWSEVDEPLARALQDIPVFTAAVARLKETGKSLPEREIRRTEMSADLVFQSLRLAASKRRLQLDGQVGSEISYDPVLFHSDDLVKLGEKVRIRKPAVTRGEGKTKVIIQLGLADALYE